MVGWGVRVSGGLRGAWVGEGRYGVVVVMGQEGGNHRSGQAQASQKGVLPENHIQLLHAVVLCHCNWHCRTCRYCAALYSSFVSTAQLLRCICPLSAAAAPASVRCWLLPALQLSPVCCCCRHRSCPLAPHLWLRTRPVTRLSWTVVVMGMSTGNTPTLPLNCHLTSAVPGSTMRMPVTRCRQGVFCLGKGKGEGRGGVQVVRAGVVWKVGDAIRRMQHRCGQQGCSGSWEGEGGLG